MTQSNEPRPSGRLPTPARRVRTDYKGLIAPYSQFRPTTFYSTLARNGTYTGDIWGCPWRCHLCWSHSGRVDEPVNLECSPSLVVDKFIKGMERNGMAGSRISGGDVGYWWDHVRAVVDEFLDRTGDSHLHVTNGHSRENIWLVLETSGGITITPEQLIDIERRHGEHAKGLALSIGMKATNPEQLARLTGMPLRAAAAAHQRQLAVIEAACRLEHVQPIIGFLRPYAPEGEFLELREWIDGLRPGMSRYVDRLSFRNYN